MTHEGNLG